MALTANSALHLIFTTNFKTYNGFQLTSLTLLFMRRGAAATLALLFACTAATTDSFRLGRYAGAEILRRGSS